MPVPNRQPNEELRQIAANYKAAHGVDVPDYGSTNTLDEARARRIADAFHAMPHQPDHPEVQAAYDALKAETAAQYRWLLRHGYQFTPYREGQEPYKDSAEMMEDMRGNKHMAYYPTDVGFGSDGVDYSDHPLYAFSPYEDRFGQPMRYNDLFRVVHDAFGHAVDGHQFGPKGEENAWRAHSAMFSPQAQRALTTETRGQNSWVNFGPHLRREDGSLPVKGEADWIHPAQRPFADQKAGLLPEEFNQVDGGVRKALVLRR